ncbi:hypothetical protein SARC_04062 [Sphaeroforma arctica JP610]|uniref:Uncharacterized protein n=1 Tax=Sphaeroforma arctica JP610 TaxID=667725 RepID=A0A0L0G665_9EUKA|nr:hypothetical protein SARC_04062 [Sphaeroforma arctica JP610]KNC83703.1 hypothetical protein SARC_04062 [Sphaeroforma arctica JP610]|eukprot:XP_014157605.1 hypothetical protein SARC_04062 [Sphaeroforma arctica JP610]
MSTSQHHKADPRSRRSAHTQSSSQSQAHRAEQAMKGFVYESRRTVRERREKYGVGKEWGVMQKILKDLQRLSRMAKAYKMFLKLGIVKALDSFLMDPLPQDILVMCLSIVANLASDSNVCAVMGPSMVQRISDKLIESDSILSRAKGVRALTNMVANPKCAQEIRKCGIGVQLIGWLKACLPPWDLIFASEIGKEEDEEEERASVPGGIVLVGGWMDRWNTETDDAADTKNEEVQEAEETRRGREYIQNKDNRDFLYASLRLLAAVGSIVQVTSASSEAVAVKPQHLVAPVISPLDPHNAQAHAHTRTHMQKSQGLNTSYTTTVVAKTNPLAPVVDVVGCAFVVARYATCFLLVSQALKVLYVYRDHTLSEPDKGTALPSPMSIPPSNAGIGKIDTSNVPRLSGAVAWSERVLDVKRGDGMGLFQSLVHAMVRRAIVGEKGITEEVSTVDEKPSLETPGQEQAYVTADHSSIALTKESVADVYVALQYTLVLLLQWAETAVVIRLRMATQDLIDDLCALVLHTQGKRSVRVLVARLLCVLSEEAVTRGKIKRADGCQGLVQVLLSSPFLNTMLASEERDGRAGLGLEASGDIRRKEGHRVLHAASAHTEEAQQGSETANPRSKQPQTDQQRANVGVDQVTEASGPSSIEVQGSTALHAHNVNDISETEVKGHKEADIKTVTDTTIDNNSPAIDPAIERNPHANLNVVRALLKGLSFYRFDASTLASFFVASAGRHCLSESFRRHSTVPLFLGLSLAHSNQRRSGDLKLLHSRDLRIITYIMLLSERPRPDTAYLKSEDLNNLLHSRDLPIITYTMLLMETATATERSSDAKDVVMDAKLLYTIARLVSESPERSPLRKQGVFIFRHLICAHCLPKLVKFDVLQIIDAMERQQETRSR